MIISVMDTITTIIVTTITNNSYIQNILRWFLIGGCFLLFAAPPLTFEESKIFLKKLPVQGERKTFYCQATWTSTGKVIAGCPEGWSEDDCRLEWDHVVPASILGQDLPCWRQDACPWPQKSHRACCRDISPEFVLREANVFNLVPVLKKMNRARSNFLPGIVSHKHQALELCGVWIDARRKTFEPPDSLKGRVARIYLQIYNQYHFPISQRRLQILKDWDRQYPMQEDEKRYIVLLNNTLSLGQNKESIYMTTIKEVSL